MDHRRSSFLIGSRTRRNVLKGKNVRKQNDGADNFADYWTDSGGEDSSSTDSDNYSDLSKTQNPPNVSEIRLKTLRQNVKTIPSSRILHSGTNVKDKQGHTKILTSPLEPVKNTVSDYDKNIHNSPTKKPKVSSKLQRDEYQNSTMNNVFNHPDQSPVRSECSLTSTISQHSVSDSKDSKKKTGISVTSTLPKIKNKVESSQISLSTSLTSNNNKTENIELNMYHHSANSLRDSMQKEASPLLSKSKGKEKKIVSPKKCLMSRNLNETISLPQAYDCDDISSSSLSPISKQSKDMGKTFVMNENVSQANVDASDIHMLSSVKVISTGTNLTNATESEINPLDNKTSHERNSHIEHKEVSSIFRSGCGNHTVMKIRNSSQISKTFAKYDEYDAQIMEMVHDNESRLKVLTNEQSLILSSPKPSKENEAELNNSESDTEYEETNIVAQKETGGNVKSQSSECVSNNKILTRSQQKNSVSRDRINTELFQERLVSDKENFELADISHTSLHNHKSQTENVLLSKSVKNLAHSSQSSGRNINVSLHQRKSNDAKSFLKRKSTSRTSPHKPILRSNSKNRQHSTINSSNIVPKSTDRNDSETNDTSNDEVEAGNGSDINDNVYLSHISHTQDNDLLRSHKLKSGIDKSKEKSRTQKSFSGKNEAESNNSESDTEYKETNIVAQEETDGNVKSQNSECVSNNKRLTRSQQKNSVSRDRINTELFQERLVSDKDNFELADISHTSLHNHKSQTENVLLSKSVKNLAHLSQSSGRNINVSLHERKSNDVKSFLKRKSTSRTSPHKPILRSNSKNRQHSTINSSNIVPKSTDKNDSETNDTSNDEVEAGNGSDVNDDVYLSHISHIQDNDFLRSHKLKSCIDKSKEKSRTQKSFSDCTIENAAENHEIVKQPTSLYNKQEKIANKIQENLKASETVFKDNTEGALNISESDNKIPENLDSKKRKRLSKIHRSSLNTSESENEIPEDLESNKRKHVRKIHKSALDTSESENVSEDLDDKKRKHVSKITKNLKVSKSISRHSNVIHTPSKENEMSQNFDNEKGKHVNKAQSKLKASESFSAKNTETATDIPANKNEISQNINSKKKKHVSKIPKISKAIKGSLNNSTKSATDIPANEIEISQNFENEKKKHANNDHENLELPGASSSGVKNVNKTHKKVRISENFSTKNTESITDIPANENISQSLNSKKKKHVNKIPKISEIEISQNFDHEREKHTNNTHENLIAFSTEGTENAADVSSKENETMQNLHIKRKRPVSKIYEKLKTSRTLSKNIENINPEINNGGSPNFHRGKKNTKKKNKEKQKRTETFSSETFIRDNQNTDDFLEAETGTTSIHKKRKKHATESHQNLSNDQLVSSSKEKKENAPLRRSARQKFPPLASWRNERILYRVENGITKVIGVDKGREEDDAVIKSLQRLLGETKKKKKKKIVVKKCKVQDIINKKNVHLSLVKHFDAVPWDKGYQDKDCPYRIKRVFESETAASGFIQIEINEKKPMQYMPSEDICITVIKGKIEVTIDENVNLVEEKCMFIVPRCVPYCLKNVGSIKAILTFCVGKFHYLESHS